MIRTTNQQHFYHVNNDPTIAHSCDWPFSLVNQMAVRPVVAYKSNAQELEQQNLLHSKFTFTA